MKQIPTKIIVLRGTYTESSLANIQIDLSECSFVVFDLSEYVININAIRELQKLISKQNVSDLVKGVLFLLGEASKKRRILKKLARTIILVMKLDFPVLIKFGNKDRDIYKILEDAMINTYY